MTVMEEDPPSGLGVITLDTAVVLGLSFCSITTYNVKPCFASIKGNGDGRGSSCLGQQPPIHKQVRVARKYIVESAESCTIHGHETQFESTT